jgi:RecB family exonuclease
VSAGFPIPKAIPLQRWAPTTANRLLRCGLAQAFSQDHEWKTLSRPSTHSVLGSAVHKLTELALSGQLLTNGPLAVDEQVRAVWDELVTQGLQRLQAAWAPAQVPQPSLWPNYQLLSIRARRRAERLAVENRRARHGQGTPPKLRHSLSVTVAEHEFRDDDIGLRGTPDLVERKAGSVRVLDLKTGLRQGEPTADQRRQLLLYAHLIRAHDKRTPDECAIVDGVGDQHPVPVSDSDIDLIVKEASEAVAAYNTGVEHGDVMTLARPSATACRWCSFRAVCRPYFQARQADWPGARGDVHGELLSRESAAPGETAFTLDARLPAYLAGETIRVGGMSHGEIPPEGACSVVEADLLGGPRAQRLRWDSTVVTIPSGKEQHGWPSRCAERPTSPSG